MTIRASLHPLLSEHHSATIGRVVEHFCRRDDILALLLTGSLAHGFARPASDVDIAVIVSAADYQRRKLACDLNYYDESLCTYAGGYVDGKYVDVQFIRDVAAHGSEPARFAFKDARILISRVDGLVELLAAAARYPVEHKAKKLSRFMAQFEAWNWYVLQALQTGDRYLLRIASAKLALFGCRLILAHNELLYPYHKWLTRVVAHAASKPANFERLLEDLLSAPTAGTASAFHAAVKSFRDWPAAEVAWSMQFMIDSELNWQSGHIPVDDL